MLVFLTEEASISPVIRKLIHDLWPAAIEGLNWQIVAHQGKADLEANMVKKMKSWNYNSPHFIILRDNDGGDCRVLKQRLLTLVCGTGKPSHIRIVCQELEAWFLGDLAAVEAAYPLSRASAQQNRNPYRTPDVPTNASQLLDVLTGSTAKVGRSEQIAPHLDIHSNLSASFQMLVNLLRNLIPNHT